MFGGHTTFGDARRYWDFRTVGRGDVNFDAIIVALHDLRYAGPLSIEWEDARMDRVFGAAESAAYIRKLDFPASEVAFDAAFAKSEAESVSDSQRPLRWAMVGGGKGAFIGAVHRHAAALDGRYELVAGALSSTPERSRASGAALGLAPERSYGTWQALLASEQGREDGAEVISIVTPNHLHFPVALARGAGRDPRRLRQAAGAYPGAGRVSWRRGAGGGQRLRGDLQLLRLPHDPSGPRDGARRAYSARFAR